MSNCCSVKIKILLEKFNYLKICRVYCVYCYTVLLNYTSTVGHFQQIHQHMRIIYLRNIVDVLHFLENNLKIFMLIITYFDTQVLYTICCILQWDIIIIFQQCSLNEALRMEFSKKIFSTLQNYLSLPSLKRSCACTSLLVSSVKLALWIALAAMQIYFHVYWV